MMILLSSIIKDNNVEISLFNLVGLAHFLIGFYFIFFGIWNIYHWTPILQVMIEKNIPHLLLPLGISWQVILGGMVMGNMLVKLAALFLIPFLVLSVVIFHPFWKMKGEQRKLSLTLFVANMTISLGALLLLMTPINHLKDFFS
jgi:uncharacterized membrane protein YphA (DoxX/SURF4 family)